jgi:hypothetical protein
LAFPLPTRSSEEVARLNRLVARLVEHGLEVEGPSMTLSYAARETSDRTRAISLQSISPSCSRPAH